MTRASGQPKCDEPGCSAFPTRQYAAATTDDGRLVLRAVCERHLQDDFKPLSECQ